MNKLILAKKRGWNCFSCKKANLCRSTLEELECVACNFCEKSYHVICDGSYDEDQAAEN